MIGRPVAIIPRRERRGSPHDFHVTHDPREHAPLGLHRVYVDGREIGRQISMPSRDDCERMLSPPPVLTLAGLKRGYTAATKARQQLTAQQRQALRGQLQDDCYGRLSFDGVLP